MHVRRCPRHSGLRRTRGVKTTRGVVSRIGPPAVHTGLSINPVAPRCLLASRPGRPLPDGPHRPWLERPPPRRAWCGIAASVFSQLAARLPGVAPAPTIRAGRLFSAAAKRRSKRSPSSRPSERRASPLPLDSPDRPSWSNAAGRPFVLAYVDSNVSVSHPNNRARTNRDEEAVALGAGAGARPSRGAGEGWPDDARSGPRRRQRRRLPGTLRRHQGTDRRAGVPVRHGRDLPLFRFRGLRQPHRNSPCGSGGNAGSFARRYARAASAMAATCRRPPGAGLTFGRRCGARFILTSAKPPGAPRRYSGWAGTFRSEPSTTGPEAIASAHGRNRAPNAGSMAFPHGIAGPGATPREGRMAVHMPTVAVPYQAPEGWGRSGHRPEGPHGIGAPVDTS